MKTEKLFYTTRDGYELFVTRFIPDDETLIKGIIQYHHGMMEHIFRYEDLAEFITSKGYVFNAYDCRGHGESAQNKYNGKKEYEHLKYTTGYVLKLADKDGFNICIDDLQEIIEDAKKRFPEKKVTLLGYSFGSFIAQGYIEKYGKNIDSCILCGTKGPEQTQDLFCKIIAQFLCLFNEDVKADILESIPIYLIYLRHYKFPYAHKLMWMAKNQEIIKSYIEDKYSYKGITRRFVVDLMGGNFEIHKKNIMKKIPTELPVIFLYGKEDPIGLYGKTINSLIKIYRKNGMKYVQSKSYNESRHEILKDIDHLKVWNDIITIAENPKQPVPASAL